MLASWKKSYDKPIQWIEKERRHFASKGLYIQSFGFSSGHVWIWELDHKNAQCWRTDAFELWCWRRLLRGLSTARRSNQSILKETNPEYSLEELMLKLKFQYIGHLCEESTHWKRPWCWERLKAGGKGVVKGWDGWMASLIQWLWTWANSEMVRDREAWHAAVDESQRVGHGLAINNKKERCEDYSQQEEECFMKKPCNNPW